MNVVRMTKCMNIIKRNVLQCTKPQFLHNRQGLHLWSVYLLCQTMVVLVLPCWTILELDVRTLGHSVLRFTVSVMGFSSEY